MPTLQHNSSLTIVSATTRNPLFGLNGYLPSWVLYFFFGIQAMQFLGALMSSWNLITPCSSHVWKLFGRCCGSRKNMVLNILWFLLLSQLMLNYVRYVKHMNVSPLMLHLWLKWVIWFCSSYSLKSFFLTKMSFVCGFCFCSLINWLSQF